MHATVQRREGDQEQAEQVKPQGVASKGVASLYLIICQFYISSHSSIGSITAYQFFCFLALCLFLHFPRRGIYGMDEEEIVELGKLMQEIHFATR